MPHVTLAAVERPFAVQVRRAALRRLRYGPAVSCRAATRALVAGPTAPRDGGA